MKRIGPVLYLVCFGILFSGCHRVQKTIDKMPWEYEGEIVFRTDGRLPGWGEAQVETFQEQYPNIDVQLEAVNEERMQRLSEDIASGDLPDVIVTVKPELAMAKQLDGFVDLKAAPYEFDPSLLVDYQAKYLTNERNELVGLPVGINPVVFCYRRDVAQRYLGTGDPARIAAMIPDWDTFLILGEQLENQGIYIYHGVRPLCQIILNSSSRPWIRDSEVLICDNYEEALGYIQRAVTSGVIYDPVFYQDQMLEAVAQDQLVKSALEGTALFYPAFMADGPFVDAYMPLLKESWEYILPPVPTAENAEWYVHICRGTKQAEAAYQFIQYLYGTEDGCLARYRQSGSLPGIKSLYNNDRLTQEAYDMGTDLPIELYREHISREFRQLHIFDMALEYMLGNAVYEFEFNGKTSEEVAKQMEQSVPEVIDHFHIDVD